MTSSLVTQLYLILLMVILATLITAAVDTGAILNHTTENEMASRFPSLDVAPTVNLNHIPSLISTMTNSSSGNNDSSRISNQHHHDVSERDSQTTEFAPVQQRRSPVTKVKIYI